MEGTFSYEFHNYSTAFIAMLVGSASFLTLFLLTVFANQLLNKEKRSSRSYALVWLGLIGMIAGGVFIGMIFDRTEFDIIRREGTHFELSHSVRFWEKYSFDLEDIRRIDYEMHISSPTRRFNTSCMYFAIVLSDGRRLRGPCLVKHQTESKQAQEIVAATGLLGRKALKEAPPFPSPNVPFRKALFYAVLGGAGSYALIMLILLGFWLLIKKAGNI